MYEKTYESFKKWLAEEWNGYDDLAGIFEDFIAYQPTPQKDEVWVVNSNFDGDDHYVVWSDGYGWLNATRDISFDRRDTITPIRKVGEDKNA